MIDLRRAAAGALDGADELAPFRERFVIDDELVWLTWPWSTRTPVRSRWRSPTGA